MPHILTARSSRIACVLAIAAATAAGCGDADEQEGPGTAGGLTGRIQVTAQAGALAFALAATDQFHTDNPDVVIGVRRASRACPDGTDVGITSALRPTACGELRPEAEAFVDFVSKNSDGILRASRHR